MNPLITIEPLGAAREVGRSCIIVTFQDVTSKCRVLLDCGVHIGYDDERKWPDFTKKGWTTARALNENIQCVLITHFHLDHSGALPWFTETLGYEGPLIMSHPTKALGPIILKDFWYRANQKNRMGSHDAVQQCFQKATGIGLEQRIQVGELYITAYYAGHVLGAVMFLVEYRGSSVFYTGDFNMTPDRLIGSAKVPDLVTVDVVITEGTYCTTNRESGRAKEQEIMTQITDVLHEGGKVLVPSFAIGLSQELAMMCEQHWEKYELNFPLLCSKGMSQLAFQYYRLFLRWTHPEIQNQEHLLEFKHVSTYGDDKDVLNITEEPQVLFASNAMLEYGLSRQVFKEWAPDKKNLVVMPGYCPKGTLGNKVLGGATQLMIDNESVPVRCSILYYSLAAHADSRGIRLLLMQLNPRNIVLVHGQEERMIQFKKLLEETLEGPMNIFVPSTNQEIKIKPEKYFEVCINPNFELGYIANSSLIQSQIPHEPPILYPWQASIKEPFPFVDLGTKKYCLIKSPASIPEAVHEQIHLMCKSKKPPKNYKVTQGTDGNIIFEWNTEAMEEVEWTTLCETINVHEACALRSKMEASQHDGLSDHGPQGSHLSSWIHLLESIHSEKQSTEKASLEENLNLNEWCHLLDTCDERKDGKQSSDKVYMTHDGRIASTSLPHNGDWITSTREEEDYFPEWAYLLQSSHDGKQDDPPIQIEQLLQGTSSASAINNVSEWVQRIHNLRRV